MADTTKDGDLLLVLADVKSQCLTSIRQSPLSVPVMSVIGRLDDTVIPIVSGDVFVVPATNARQRYIFKLP